MAENIPTEQENTPSKPSSEENTPFPKRETAPGKNPKEDSKEGGGFMAAVKKVGYSVWVIVMIVGGAIAFIISLFVL